MTCVSLFLEIVVKHMNFLTALKFFCILSGCCAFKSRLLTVINGSNWTFYAFDQADVHSSRGQLLPSYKDIKEKHIHYNQDPDWRGLGKDEWSIGDSAHVQIYSIDQKYAISVELCHLDFDMDLLMSTQHAY